MNSFIIVNAQESSFSFKLSGQYRYSALNGDYLLYDDDDNDNDDDGYSLVSTYLCLCLYRYL